MYLSCKFTTYSLASQTQPPIVSLLIYIDSKYYCLYLWIFNAKTKNTMRKFTRFIIDLLIILYTVVLSITGLVSILGEVIPWYIVVIHTIILLLIAYRIFEKD